MRIALFVTCLADTLFPDVGQATVRLLERLGHRSCSRRRRPAAGRCTSTPATSGEALPLVRHYVEVFEPLRRGGRAVRVVRRVGPAPARDGGPAARRRGAGRAAPRRWPRRTYELSELLVDVLGVEDVGAYYPHRVTYHPTCHSLRMLRVGDKPLRLLRQVPGIDLVELPDAEQPAAGSAARSRSRTPTPPPRCWPTRCASVLATGAEVCTAGDSSCLMHIGGGLSRLRAGHPDRAPGRDPRLDPEPATGRHAMTFLGMPPVAPPGVGHLRGAEPFPAAARAGAGRHPAARATSATPPRPSGPSGPRWSASCRTGRSCATPGEAIKAGDHGPPGRATWSSWRTQVTARGGVGALGPRRERGQPDRHRPGPRDRGRPRWSRSSRWPPRRSGSTRRWPRAGIAAYETDLAELIVQLGARPAVAHPGAGHPPQPGRDPGDLPARDGRRGPGADRRPGRAGRGGPAAPAAQVPVRPGRRSAGPTSPSPRPARCAWSSPRATAGCA